MQFALKTLLFAMVIAPLQFTKAFEDASAALYSGARVVLLHSETDYTQCLALPDDTPGPWERVIMKPCQTGVDGQPWCLDGGNSSDPYTRISVNGCDDTQPNQAWYYTDDKHLAVLDQNRCLDLKDGSVEGGGWLQTWECSAGNEHQAWWPELADL